MAAHHANPWWFALLRDGPGSPTDRFFEVDWQAGGGKIVLPVLGASPAELTARGEIEVEGGADGVPVIRYHDHRFPLRADATVEPGASAAAIESALRAQHYELAEWRDGLRRINYRRFFNISELVGVQIDDPLVFDALHAKTLELVRRGLIDGVRVDHIDGLRDPLAYLRRLRRAIDDAAATSVPRSAASFGAAPEEAAPHLPIFVEKILGLDETIPDEWPVDGATGYGFISALLAAMVDPADLGELRRHAIEQSTGARDFRELAIACKREVAVTLLAPELDRLRRRVESALRIAGLEPDGGERDALVAISSRLPTYRTYADESGMTEADREIVRGAAAGTPPAIMELLTLTGRFERRKARAAALDVVRAWQQFTGPLAAKGVEDTALHRDVACLAMNDVGTEPVPHDASRAIEALAAQRRLRPLWINATDTHDAKRSEDVRARLAAVSRRPKEWLSLLDDIVPRLRYALAEHASPPSDRDLSLLVRTAFTLIPQGGGSRRTLGERLKAFLEKAVREAGLASNWTRPERDYEAALRQAVDLLLMSRPFASARKRMIELARLTRPTAARLSIASVLLKTLFPGTPDWYQGAECRLLSLVDPDNRRPVDFAERRRLMSVLRAKWEDRPSAPARDAMRYPDRDASKLYFTWRALAIRRTLMSHAAPLELEDASITRSAWRWSIRAGALRCSVRVSIERRAKDGAPVPPSSRSDVRDEVNQLTGFLDDHAAFASVVVHGETSLL